MENGQGEGGGGVGSVEAKELVGVARGCELWGGVGEGGGWAGWSGVGGEVGQHN